MKLLALLTLLVATSASAATIYQDRDHTPQLIDPVAMPRLKLWPNHRHTQSATGQILVCPYDRLREFGEIICVDNNKQNAWILLQDVKIPGHRLKAYELRSNGTLITYWGPNP